MIFKSFNISIGMPHLVADKTWCISLVFTIAGRNEPSSYLKHDIKWTDMDDVSSADMYYKALNYANLCVDSVLRQAEYIKKQKISNYDLVVMLETLINSGKFEDIISLVRPGVF